jgi:hypothetical protein
MTDEQPTIEERLTLVEKRQLEMTKALVRLAKILKSLHPDSDITEGGFGLTPDEENQLDDEDLYSDEDDEAP